MSAIQETPVWFSQPDLIPSEDMDMARKSLFANDEAEFASRIAMYVRYRSGGFNDSWVKSHIHTHEEAIVKVAENSWYGKKDNLPETDVADAALQFASDEPAEFEWRMENYKLWRCGYGASVRMWRKNWMNSHEEAVALTLRLCKCLHKWEKTSNYDSTNKFLGTYDRGYYRVCTKCQEQDSVRTSFNNYAGD